MHLIPITSKITLTIGRIPETPLMWITMRQGQTSLTAVIEPDRADQICEAIAATIPTGYVPALPEVAVYRPVGPA